MDPGWQTACNALWTYLSSAGEGFTGIWRESGSVKAEAFHNNDLVGKIHASGCEVEGFGDTTPSVIEDATKGAHGPIVPHHGTEERVTRPRGKVEPPAKCIVKIGRFIHNETEYKLSVALSRYADAKAARYRYVGHEFMHRFGGESVAPSVR